MSKFCFQRAPFEPKRERNGSNLALGRFVLLEVADASQAGPEDDTQGHVEETQDANEARSDETTVNNTDPCERLEETSCPTEERESTERLQCNTEEAQANDGKSCSIVE